MPHGRSYGASQNIWRYYMRDWVLKPFSEEEREKCLKVAEAFHEYFEEMTDTTIVDAGKFGIIWLRWYDGSQFDAQEMYTDSIKLFNALFEAWKEHHLLMPVLGTPTAELEYEEMYERLTPEEKATFEEKRQYFWEKSLWK